MEWKTTCSGQPYRAAPALGRNKSNVHAEAFHRQKRYIGRVIKAGPLFWIEREYTEERLEQQAENFEEAIDLLYVLCRMSGYLTQGHENCLRGAEKVGARSYLGSARGRAASASSIRHYNTNNELAGTGSCLHYG